MVSVDENGDEILGSEVRVATRTRFERGEWYKAAGLGITIVSAVCAAMFALVSYVYMTKREHTADISKIEIERRVAEAVKVSEDKALAKTLRKIDVRINTTSQEVRVVNENVIRLMAVDEIPKRHRAVLPAASRVTMPP